MKHLMAMVFFLFSSPSLASVITFDFTRLVLGTESQQSSLVGQITFDENETQFNANTWLSFFFQLEFDGVTYDIFEQDIAFFEISNLEDGVFGNDNNEGFELYLSNAGSTYEFSVFSGLAGLGQADTCVFDVNGSDRCSGSLFLVVKTGGETSNAVKVNEPEMFATAVFALLVLTSLRIRKV